MEVKLTAVVLKYVKLNYMSKTRLRSKIEVVWLTPSSVKSVIIPTSSTVRSYMDAKFIST